MTHPHLLKLQQWGHFANPAMPNAMDAQADVDDLDLADLAAREAIRSYQEFFRDTIDEVSQEVHRRDSVADGEVGPATERVLHMPRCGQPDYAVSEEANWPTDCRGSLKAGRDFDSLPGLTKEETDMVWWAITNNLTAAIADLEITPVFDDPVRLQMDFWAFLRRLSGSTLAWHELATSDCSAVLDGAWDSDRDWSVIGAATTGTHEFGHGLGMNHNNDSSALMYPIINSAARARRGWPNRTDFAQLQRLGYRISNPVQPTIDELYVPRNKPQPPPEPPDPGTDVHLPWVLTHTDPNGRERRFKLYEEIEV